MLWHFPVATSFLLRLKNPTGTPLTDGEIMQVLEGYLDGIGDTIDSATQGSVLFAGASGILSQDNANFFWDDANKRLGIGTGSPTEMFELSGGKAVFDNGTNQTIINGKFIQIGNGALTFSNDDSDSIGFYFDSPYLKSNGTFIAMADSAYGFSMAENHPLSFSSGNPEFITPDLYLYREGSNTLAQRNSTNAQTFRLYNTYTDASNYERAILDWNSTSNVLTLGTEAAGTGAVRDIALNGW